MRSIRHTRTLDGIRRTALYAILALALPAYSGTPTVSEGSYSLSVIVNAANPIESLTREQVRKLLNGEVRHWPDKTPVVVAFREESSEAYRQILRLILRMSASEYRRHLLAIEFRTGEPFRVRTLNSTENANKFVYNVPGALSVVDAVPSGAVSERIKVLRIDGKRPGEAGYGLQ